MAQIKRRAKRSAKHPLPPSRAGKKPVTAYVDKDLYKTMRRLGIELEKPAQQMLTEALKDYLEKHNTLIK